MYFKLDVLFKIETGQLKKKVYIGDEIIELIDEDILTKFKNYIFWFYIEIFYWCEII